MLYRAKENGDQNIFKCKVIGNGSIFGYKLVKTYFVDNSGFGKDNELALTSEQFLKEVKQGFYYGILTVGQFQVYIGEFKKINRKKTYEAQGIANSKLISKSCRIIKYNNGDFTVKLYTTDILKISGDKIILNSGGYRTYTTKRRLNQFLSQYNITVYQKNYQWLIQDKGNIQEFSDGIELKIDK